MPQKCPTYSAPSGVKAALSGTSLKQAAQVIVGSPDGAMGLSVMACLDVCRRSAHLTPAPRVPSSRD